MSQRADMLTTPIKLPIIVRTMTVASIFRIPYAVLAFHKLFVLTACNTRINTDRLYENDPSTLGAERSLNARQFRNTNYCHKLCFSKGGSM